jgi:RNA polymerase sigma-70 factor, ECF subfamily
VNSLPAEVTSLLNKMAEGDQSAAERLVPLVYGELRQIAEHRLRHERPNHTLQATALVNEAYMKLAAQHGMKWQNRAQFFGIASQAMRRILVDYARGRLRLRRGGKQEKVALDAVVLVSPDRTAEVLAVHESLSKLEKLDPRQGRIVELHYFGGLTIEEIAEILSLSGKTVARELKVAKAWLYGDLKEEHEGRRTHIEAVVLSFHGVRCLFSYARVAFTRRSGVPGMDFASDNWERVKQLFEEALDLESSQWPAFLANNCDDENLRQQIEKLLSDYKEAGSFLDEPVLSSKIAAPEVHAKNTADFRQKISSQDVFTYAANNDGDRVLFNTIVDRRQATPLWIMRTGRCRWKSESGAPPKLNQAILIRLVPIWITSCLSTRTKPLAATETTDKRPFIQCSAESNVTRPATTVMRIASALKSLLGTLYGSAEITVKSA